MQTVAFADTTPVIRRIVEENGRLTMQNRSLGDDTNLFEAGMTVHDTVNVLLSLEDAFDVQFPDHVVSRHVFKSVTSIRTVLEQLILTRTARASAQQHDASAAATPHS